MLIMTLNCGSSSVKYSLVDTERETLLAQGTVERVGLDGSFVTHEYGGFQGSGVKSVRIEADCPTHTAAIQLVIDRLCDPDHGALGAPDDTNVPIGLDAIAAVGHRVVHGGEALRCSTIIDDEVLATIEGCAQLAPLHNPPNLAGIRAAQALLPAATHVAVFDTAFHSTMPKHAYLYAVPYEWYTRHQLRRYGFHGTSHLYVSKRAAVLLGRRPDEVRVITLHIGNGASAAAVDRGRAIDTSMGFTPLEGLVMGTRCGDLDPAIPLYLMQREGLDAAAMDRLLNKKSGVLGLSGRYSDMREIEGAAVAGDERCQLAIDVYCYRLKKYVGAYLAAMGGADAIVFTAGVGEHSALVRERVCDGLDGLGIVLDPERNAAVESSKREYDIAADGSNVRIFVVPTNEELVIVEDTHALLTGRYEDHLQLAYCFSSEQYRIF